MDTFLDPTSDEYRESSWTGWPEFTLGWSVARFDAQVALRSWRQLCACLLHRLAEQVEP